MEQKNIVAPDLLKMNGQAVRGIEDTPRWRTSSSWQSFTMTTELTKIIIFDLSDDDEEHEKNIHTIKNINRNVEIKTCAGGNINRLEDIKKFIYAGCLQVIVNGAKANSIELAEEASKRFGKDRILVSVENVDFVFKHQAKMNENFHELLVLNTSVLDAIENITDVPYVVYFETCDYEKIIEVLKRSNTRGIAGRFLKRSEYQHHGDQVTAFFRGHQDGQF